MGRTVKEMSPSEFKSALRAVKKEEKKAEKAADRNLKEARRANAADKDRNYYY